MSSSRNHPCPCGSGKKFKRCCGLDSGAAVRPTVEEHREAFAMLERELSRLRFREHCELGEALFWEPWTRVLDEEILEKIRNQPGSRHEFLCYLALDARLEERSHNVVADMLERRDRRLSPGVLRVLEGLATARLDLYEVRAIDPGATLLLVRVEDGEELSVGDRVLGPLECGDLLAARVVCEAPGELGLVGELYNFPASSRAKLLEHLAKYEPAARDGRAFHGFWLSEQLAVGGRGIRPAKIYPHLTADMRHYLDGEDLSIRVPKEARAIALYIGRIAAAASTSPAGDTIDTGVACRRRPRSRPCPANVTACSSRRGHIDWSCPGCGDSGAISGWEDTPFDRRGRITIEQHDEKPSPDVRVAVLRERDYRRLLGLVHLTAPALRYLVSARLNGDGFHLIGTAAELAALAHCIAFHFARANVSRAAREDLVGLHEYLALFAGARPDLSMAAQCAEVLLFERSRRKAPRPTPSGRTGTHRLHVRLLDIEPPIWRRLELPSRFTLEDLYEALILAFEWSDTHLHVFEQGARRFGLPNPEWEEPIADERAVLLAEVLPHPGASIVWEYDFGDSWRHEITVEELLPDPPKRPRLLAGARAAPPEDCGGPPGYEHLLAALADPFHEEHESLRTWSDEFDAEAFDVEKLDERVARLGLTGEQRCERAVEPTARSR